MIHFQAKALLRFATLSFTALVFIVFAGTGCQPQKQIGLPAKITIAHVTLPAAALVQIAFAKGYFTEEGLDATPQPHAFGKLALDAVIEGKADLATPAAPPSMLAIMDGRKIAILAMINTANRITAVVARQDRGIAKPSDLKGKKIGVTQGTVSDFFIHVFLTANGIDREQVTMIDLKPEEMVAALGTGKVDAVSTWNPYLQLLQKELGNQGLTFYEEKLYTEIMCLTAGQDFVHKNPETIKKVLKALIRAETFARQNPEESRCLVAEFIKVDKVILDETWDIYNFRVTLDQAILADLEDQTRWALKNRLTARRDMPHYLDFIYVEGLQAVKPEAVRIIR